MPIKQIHNETHSKHRHRLRLKLYECASMQLVLLQGRRRSFIKKVDVTKRACPASPGHRNVQARHIAELCCLEDFLLPPNESNYV